ncbi:MAG: adenosine deaminase, partial [bacterium]
MTPSRALVESLPKIDLHRHLDGSIRTETILELAQEHGIELPARTSSELEPHVTVSPYCRDLSEFLSCFETFYPVLQFPQAMERIALELCEDLVEENVIYAEVRFAPVLLTEAGHSQREMVEAVLSGLSRGTEGTNTDVNLILCFYRGTDPGDSTKTLEVARQFRDSGVVGIDLAGDESSYPAEP